MAGVMSGYIMYHRMAQSEGARSGVVVTVVEVTLVIVAIVTIDLVVTVVLNSNRSI